jgi:hypothetical protein
MPLKVPDARCSSHELLLQYWHDPRMSFYEVIVCYADRGAPGDRSLRERQGNPSHRIVLF